MKKRLRRKPMCRCIILRHAGKYSLMKKRLRRFHDLAWWFLLFSRKVFADEEAIETKPRRQTTVKTNFPAGKYSLMKKRLRRIFPPLPPQASRPESIR